MFDDTKSVIIVDSFCLRHIILFPFFFTLLSLSFYIMSCFSNDNCIIFVHFIPIDNLHDLSCPSATCACVINKYFITRGMYCSFPTCFFCCFFIYLFFILSFFFVYFPFFPPHFFSFFPSYLGFAYFFFFFPPLYVSINRGLFFKSISYRLKPKILAHVLRLCTTTVRVRTGA